MHAHELHRVPRHERERTGEHPVEDHAERVDVARGAGRQPARLLRGDVGRRAEDGPGLGERARSAHPRDPEVGDLDALLGVEEHVRGLQVAVHEPAVVRMSETGRHPGRDPERLGIRLPLPVAEPVLQRAVREVLEHHVRAAVCFAVVVEGADVRMRERGDRPGLAFEPRAIGARREHLHCDLPLELVVVGEPDCAHRPAAERFEQPVSAGDRLPCHLRGIIVIHDERPAEDRRSTRARARARRPVAARGRADRRGRGPCAGRGRAGGHRPAAVRQLRDGRLRGPCRRHARPAAGGGPLGGRPARARSGWTG